MNTTEQQDSYSHILKYTGVFGGVQGLNILVGIVRNKLVAIILGPAGMGLISLFNSTIKFFSDSTNLGVPMSAVKEVSEAYSQGNDEVLGHCVQQVRMWSVLTALLGMLLCAAFGPLLNKGTFTWGNHTLHFVLLSPVVAFMALTGGEMAILKGTRKLGRLAVLSVYNVVLSLLISVPLYYIWHQAAIVPSLVLLSGLQMVITLRYSYQLFPLRPFWHCKGEAIGWGIVKLGTAFVLAGILGSGAEFLIRTYLSYVGGLSDVGMYNAAYMMTMTYAGMVFSAMETDYFPRLSSIRDVGDQLNRTVSRQIEVSLLLIAPLLVGLLVGLPILLPLLYSNAFLPMIHMMRITVLAMFFRAVSLPIEYIALAKGDSKSYLALECFYDVLMVLLVIFGYHAAQLTGTGIALLGASVLNTVTVILYMHHKYSLHLSKEVYAYFCLFFPFGGGVILLSYLTTGWLYWVLGGICAFISFVLSILLLHSKSHLWNRLKERVMLKWNIFLQH